MAGVTFKDKAGNEHKVTLAPCAFYSIMNISDPAATGYTGLQAVRHDGYVDCQLNCYYFKHSNTTWSAICPDTGMAFVLGERSRQSVVKKAHDPEIQAKYKAVLAQIMREDNGVASLYRETITKAKQLQLVSVPVDHTDPRFPKKREEAN